MRELVFLSMVIAFMVIPIGMAHAQTTYVINMPTGAASPDAPYFWQVESTGNTDGILTVEVLDSVRWENADTALHTVTSGTPEDGPSEIFDSGLFNPGEDFTYQFTETGEYDYFCLIHPWMIGTITVVETSQGKVLENVASGLDSNGMGFDVNYVLDRHLEDNVVIDQTRNTVTFIVAGETENDQLEIRLPEGLIKNPNAVWVDGSQITDYKSEKQGSTTVLTIPLQHNSEEIVVMGTQVIPEFGTIAGAVLIVSIMAVIFITTKTQKFGIPKL